LPLNYAPPEIGCESRNRTCRFAGYESAEPSLLHSRAKKKLVAETGFEPVVFGL
jgi:hypothetical protein